MPLPDDDAGLSSGASPRGSEYEVNSPSSILLVPVVLGTVATGTPVIWISSTISNSKRGTNRR